MVCWGPDDNALTGLVASITADLAGTFDMKPIVRLWSDAWAEMVPFLAFGTS